MFLCQGPCRLLFDMEHYQLTTIITEFCKESLLYLTPHIHHLHKLTYILPFLILRIILNAGAIYLANSLVDGFTFSGNFVMLFFIGGILAVFQSFIYPLLKIIAFPLVLLSFGLFGFIVNAAVLWGISYFFAELSIDGINNKAE